jgi:dTDP-4-amino-4,6-dideoxygalactose transaminase
VIVPSFTFLASALGCAWTNAKPIFVDVSADDWNADPEAVEAAITPATSAILATHVFGNPCRIARLQEIASRRKLVLIFDAAHGFGALYQGKPLGANGDCEVFSCSPTKLVQCGEGGVVTTNRKDILEKLTRLREYGNDGNYDLVEPGLNGRLSEVNALLGLHSLKRLEHVSARRNCLAQYLKEQLADLPGLSWQFVDHGNQSSFKDLVCLINADQFGISRDMLSAALVAENIETRNYYDPPCHRQHHWIGQTNCGPLPVTERLSSSCLTLPLSSLFDFNTMDTIARAIRQIHSHAWAISRLLG